MAVHDLLRIGFSSWENDEVIPQFENMNEGELLTFIREQERVVMTFIATDPDSEQRYAAAKLLVDSKQALTEKRLAKHPVSGRDSTNHTG